MLQISNSSAIRYSQLFDIDKSINVYCNRGTSGIDGSTSTAIGASINYKHNTVLSQRFKFLLRQQCFVERFIPLNFRIILINNRGGGIFKILTKDNSSELFKKFFETKHHLSAKELCKMYGFDFYESDDESKLKLILNDFYQPSNKPKLLEVVTDSIYNQDYLLNYFEFIK